MHEVSICQSIISTIENEFEPSALEQIREIHLKVGVLSCVQPLFVKQVFSMMIPETFLRQATLCIEQVEILVECETCQNQFKVENHVYTCKACGSVSTNIIEGNELLIHKIILEEPAHEKIDE